LIVNLGRRFAVAAALASTCLLAACGGGSDAVVTTPDTPPVATASGRDKFLLFPNPQQTPDPPGTLPAAPRIDSLAYAQAYYAAIDPNNEKDTLAKWKAANGFGTNAGTEVTVAFGDTRDLGYGRRMTGRISVDRKTIAFIVENYQVAPGGAYGYSPISLEAAVREDTRWRILVNAIEWSPGPKGGESFAKFFNFDALTGERALTVDLDGRGAKAMPGPCFTCHGGRGDALVPDATGTLRFPLVRNSASDTPGDAQARLAPLEVDHFDFSPIGGYTRPELEQRLKTMNMLVLCSYPRPATQAHGVPTSFCTRRNALPSEWQGTAGDLLINAYGGVEGLPQPSYNDTLIPPDWVTGLQRDLYANVVVPSCRACHMLRGVGGQSDIDLTTLTKFQSYANTRDAPVDDRIKVHVFDRLDMPLAKLVFDTFWSSTNPPILARFLTDRGFNLTDAAGAPPRRPIADAGPDRLITRGATTLSAEASLDANAFQWSIVSGPTDGATLLNPQSARPTFNATLDGDYVVRLIAGNGAVQGSPDLLRLSVKGGGPAPTIAFATIRPILLGFCGSCHSPPAPGVPPLPSGTQSPPVFFADRQGTNIVARTDVDALYAEVRSRINFTDIVASPLLRKPSGLHHGGARIPGFDTRVSVGDVQRANYDTFVNWIVAGAPK